MFILILGSYDHETKHLLYNLQESISNTFSREGHYGLLMEKLELFVAEDEFSGSRPVLVEKEEGYLTYYIFNPTFLLDPNPDNIDVIDTFPDTKGTEYTLRECLVDNLLTPKTVKIHKKPMFSERNHEATSGLFNFLAAISSLYFVVRLKDLTRGGEYIELCHITNMPNKVVEKHTSNIFLFRNRNVDLTGMLNLIFKDGGVSVLDFSDDTDLKAIAEEIIRRIQ